MASNKSPGNNPNTRTAVNLSNVSASGAVINVNSNSKMGNFSSETVGNGTNHNIQGAVVNVDSTSVMENFSHKHTDISTNKLKFDFEGNKVFTEDILISSSNLEEGNNGDMWLTLGEEKFEACRENVEAKSTVLSNALKQNPQSNHIIIKNVDPKVFAPVVKFFQTNKIVKLDQYSNELLKLADKFGIAKLKEDCERFINNP